MQFHFNDATGAHASQTATTLLLWLKDDRLLRNDRMFTKQWFWWCFMQYMYHWKHLLVQPKLVENSINRNEIRTISFRKSIRCISSIIIKDNSEHCLIPLLINQNNSTMIYTVNSYSRTESHQFQLTGKIITLILLNKIITRLQYSIKRSANLCQNIAQLFLCIHISLSFQSRCTNTMYYTAVKSVIVYK